MACRDSTRPRQASDQRVIGLASASAGAWKRREALEWRVVQASPEREGENSLGTTGMKTIDLVRGRMGMGGVAPHSNPISKWRACLWPSWGLATN
jgi:hypothetical protein